MKGASQSVFLQTCVVDLRFKNTWIEANLLFDSGSMRSFICKNLAERLNLPVIRKEHLIVLKEEDHRPLTFAFNKILDSCSPRQLKHLDFISQFNTDIRHVSGSNNSVADALSRINALNLSTTDLQHLSDSQTKDEELKTLYIISSNDLSIKLKPLKMGIALEIFCDVSREKVRPYVPEKLRFEVFCSLHNLSHPGIRATKRLIQDRFVWPSMLKDIAKCT
ncbi:transposon Ty3-I Gag-Pol polyprotein [Trichonephila inaurata madagascariensis]|uniref:RNA-directed DNA polymerase n=1 Tax=Trichonephila inaurata madagascariensis TaxID=2747483 RepID=A0A8X6YQW6_9ARAC|nr:transposon Ty3-I Gag-Pol polyprotein [Trichonephila inaurata madagascariensis]